MEVWIPNYGETFDVLNQKICCIEVCAKYDEVSHHKKEA